MVRWHSLAAVLLVASAAPARVHAAPTEPPAAAGGTGGALETPAPKPHRFAARALGQPVAARVEVEGLTIRDVTLLRRRGDGGDVQVGARVRLANAGSKPVAPAFRVLLYRGEEPVGVLSYPPPGTDAAAISGGASYAWTAFTGAKAGALPDAFAIAPPEAALTVHGGTAVVPSAGQGVPAEGAGGRETTGEGAAAGAEGTAKQPGQRAGRQGRQAGGAGAGRAQRQGAGRVRNPGGGGGIPNDVLRMPGMHKGGTRTPQTRGGMAAPGMRRNMNTMPGMRKNALTMPGMRNNPLHTGRRRR